MISPGVRFTGYDSKKPPDEPDIITTGEPGGPVKPLTPPAPPPAMLTYADLTLVGTVQLVLLVKV